MQLTIIGSGDAFGSGGRFNTCFLIETQGKRVALDFGASSLVALKSRQVDPNTIDGIILSHLHGDHFGGLPFLLLDAQHLSRRDRPLAIVGPPGTRERLSAAMEVLFPNSSTSKWRFAFEVGEITPGVPDEFLGLAVVTNEVVHFSGAPSTALRISDGQKTLAYSGDTQWLDALLKVANGADLYISECYDYERELTGHMHFTLLRDKLPQLKARKIMLTHMNPSMLAKRDEARALGLLVAEDGLTMDI